MKSFFHSLTLLYSLLLWFVILLVFLNEVNSWLNYFPSGTLEQGQAHSPIQLVKQLIDFLCFHCQSYSFFFLLILQNRTYGRPVGLSPLCSLRKSRRNLSPLLPFRVERLQPFSFFHSVNSFTFFNCKQGKAYEMNWLAIHLSVGFTPLPILKAILQGKAETLDAFFNFSFSSAYWLIQFFFPLSIPWPACPFTSLSIPSP